MSFTGVDSLDASIDNANRRLAEAAGAFGSRDRLLAYRVVRQHRPDSAVDQALSLLPPDLCRMLQGEAAAVRPVR